MMCAKKRLRLDRERGWIATPVRQSECSIIARIIIDSAIIAVMYVGGLVARKRGY